MPICNEDVPRVFAGLRATYESLARTDLAMQFDMFVLSDTNNADSRVAEVDAWFETCRALDAFGRIFYRWRQHRIKRKSGNIADFCRRWGRNYRYLVILDADSVMSGDCLSTLVRLMEANPGAGIIQTAPNATGRDTLHARSAAVRVARLRSLVHGGAAFLAARRVALLGAQRDHPRRAVHAALRLAAPNRPRLAFRGDPVARFCRGGADAARRLVGVDRLRRPGKLRGDAAESYRRAQARPALVPRQPDELPPVGYERAPGRASRCICERRDGVRCRVALARVPRTVDHLVGGADLARPAVFRRGVPDVSAVARVASRMGADAGGVTAGLLFLPKLLAAIAVAAHGAKPYGGGARLFASVLGESVVSMLLAPIRMLFHARFVVTTLCGWGVAWRSPPRNDAETTWSEAWRQHGTQTLIGLVWAAAVYSLNPGFLWWLLPVLGALIVAIPLSVLSSRVSLGRKLRDAGLFVIPEESHPPREIQTTMEESPACRRRAAGLCRRRRRPRDRGAAVRDGPRPPATQTCAARPARHTRARGAATGAG